MTGHDEHGGIDILGLCCRAGRMIGVSVPHVSELRSTYIAIVSVSSGDLPLDRGLIFANFGQLQNTGVHSTSTVLFMQMSGNAAWLAMCFQTR